MKRAGGDLIGYYLPTKIAGQTNFALALIGFSDLAAYQMYRKRLRKIGKKENVARIEATGCILNEDRAFVQRVGD
jgi:NIPSNAP